jgi:signal peptidase I
MDNNASIKAWKSIKKSLLIVIIIPIIILSIIGLFRLAGYSIIVNSTPSIDIGFYLLSHGNIDPVKGDYVAFIPESKEAKYAYNMGWLRPNSPYLKRVSAVANDVVCVNEKGVFVNDIKLGAITIKDRNNIVLPRAINGCVIVSNNHFLPLGDGVRNSYDGRYYGLVRVEAITGKISKLWTFK